MSAHLSVSVVIPAYNATSFIAKGINSALSQTYPIKEIIIVDDGSSDNLESVIGNYDNRLLTLVRQDNSGAAAARNKGVEIASGEYIAFLDADDYWHERKLELQMDFLSKNLDVDLCYSCCYSMDLKECDDFVFPEPDEGEPHIIEDFEEVFVNPYFGTPGVVLKRSAFMELGGYDPSLKNAEDVDLWLRISWCKKVARMPQQLFVVAKRPDSLSTTNGFPANLHVIEKFCREHPEFRDTQARTIKQAKSIVYAQWGRQMLVDNNNKIARQKFAKAMMLKPKLEYIYLWLKSLL